MAEARVLEAEVARRLAAETDVQKLLRVEMGKHVHKLSGIFASADADADGSVTRLEFRRVLPVLDIEGATVADADSLYYILSRGAESIGYRDLFLELSKANRKAETSSPPVAIEEPLPPPSRKVTPRKGTSRSASASKERQSATVGAAPAAAKPKASGRTGSAPRAGGARKK